MNRSEYAEKILGLKLHKYQKRWLDKDFTPEEMRINTRRWTGKIEYSGLIDLFYQKYKKASPQDKE